MMPVSETEKHGVSTSVSRFSNKAEHIPIKKRRFLMRSPSPPPVKISLCAEMITDHTLSQDVSNKFIPLQSSCDINVNQIVENNNCIDVKKSDKSNKSFGEDEDFSGISILAAAACSSSCGYPEDGSGIEETSVLERVCEVSIFTEVRSSPKGLLKEDVINSSEMSSGATSSCTSTEPAVELASISTTGNSSQKVAPFKKMKDASLGSDSLSFSGDVSFSKDEDVVRNKKLSSRDVRLHWDLNVVMDAWEQPLDYPSAQNDIAHNISQDAEKDNDMDIMGSEYHDSQVNLETVGAAKSCLLPSEQRALANQSSVDIKDYHGFDACLNLKQPLCLGEKSLSSSSNLNLDVMKPMVEDTKCRPLEDFVNPSGALVVAAPDQTTQLSESCTVNEADIASMKSLKFNDKHIGYQSVMEGFKSNVGVSSCQLQNHRNAFASDATLGAVSADTCISLSVSSSSKVKQNVAVPEELETPKVFYHEEKSLIENVELKALEPQEHAEFSVSDNNGLPRTEAPNSVWTVSKRCELLVALNTKVQGVSNSQDVNIVSSIETIKNLSESSPVSLKESCDFYHNGTCKTNNLDNCSNYSDNVGHEESLEHNNHAVVQCHPVLVIGGDATDEVQEDYDSQYEDGELRESSVRAWEDYDAVDREADNVDHMSNYGDTYITHPSDDHVFESGEVEDSNSERLGSAAAVVSSHDCNNDNVVFRVASEADENERGRDGGNQSTHVAEKTELNQEKELLENSKSFPDMAARGGDDIGRKNTDGLLDSQGTETIAKPKAFRRGLQSQIEGPVAHDHEYREEQLRKMDNRFEPFERVRYPFHNQGRGRQGGRWDGPSDNRRGFRRHYSPIIHGHSKLDDDADMERDDHGCVGTQDDASYSQHLFSKNRAGADRAPCTGYHLRYKSDRRFSPDRGGFGQGRSLRYGPFSENRGGRGRFNGPSPDESFQSSLKYRRPMSRRDRSISPFGGRGQSNVHHTRRKSPSGSRSRSPIIWNSPRRRLGAGNGGNNFLRHRSRSPSFRPEARLQRLRSPQQQPGFGADHSGGFRPMSRNHGSPPRNRWSSARKDEPSQFRELGYKQRVSALDRSPGRIRLRDDRGSTLDSLRNMKPHGFHRISDRIPDDACRGVRYEENFEERRKQYNPVRPLRRSFDDGMASRLHPDNNGSFSAGNSFRDRDASSFQDRGFRGIDNHIGDVSRRFRGENHSNLYERDGKFNCNSKLFGVDVDSSQNLKSEEQYLPNCAGRFSDTNGANRGCRYENYQDRRKHYGQSNIMRHSDNEDTEKRFNHDENFDDIPEFGSRSRDCDGRIGNSSTRYREDEEPVVCVQKEKLDDNSQSVGMQNSGDDDAPKGVVPS